MGHRAGRTRTTITVATAIAAAGLAAGAPPAAARALSANKDALTQTNRACDASVIPPVYGEAFGFAVVRKPAHGKLVTSVSLRGARAATTYTIRVIQLVAGDADCHHVDGLLTTDADGNAQATVQEDVLPGATGAWVDLNAADDFAHFYDTAPVSF